MNPHVVVFLFRVVHSSLGVGTVGDKGCKVHQTAMSVADVHGGEVGWEGFTNDGFQMS